MKISYRRLMNGDIQIADCSDDFAPLVSIKLHNEMIKLDKDRLLLFCNSILEVVVDTIQAKSESQECLL
jgi:hypothetical protein